MMQAAMDITPARLALTLGFVLLAGGASWLHRLDLGRDLLVGTVRCFVQLLAMGYALKVIFALDSVWLVLGVFLGMTAMAAHTVRGRVREKSVPYVLPLFVSMLVSYSLVSYCVVGVVVAADPWWTPQYFIPLSGMVLGNSMTALAISVDRLFSDLKARREEVEMKLCLGASAQEACEDIVRDSVKAGMIPTINSMMAVGLVFLPGMMTGQILGGSDPLVAVKYQIVVMLMLAASTAIGSTIAVQLVRRRCFGKSQQLLL